MKTKELLFAASGLFLLCGCSTSTREQSLKGLATDATMNTVTVAGNGDTLLFSTTNADKDGLDGLFVGDSVEVYYEGEYHSGMEALKLATIAHPETVVRTLLFEEGLRMEAVDGSNRSLYIRFSPDSLTAELYASDRKEKETWTQHTLPSGKHFWSLNDENDPVTLHRTGGCWKVTDREKILFEQPQSDVDESLGTWTESRYEGILPAADCPGIRYRLALRHRQHSGNGNFLLRLTYLEAENGNDITFVYTGKRMTQRGTPENPDATVWQLITDQGEEIYNFLSEKDGQLLTLLNRDFKKSQLPLNYTLKKVD